MQLIEQLYHLVRHDKIPFGMLFFSCCVSTVAAQTDSISGNYRLKGVVKDRSGAVFAGASLYVRKGGENRSFATNANGILTSDCNPGNMK